MKNTADHSKKFPVKNRYYYGIAMVECQCGVWRYDDEVIPCWNGTGRKQSSAEAFMQLNQSIRNFGYVIFKAVGLIKATAKK